MSSPRSASPPSRASAARPSPRPRTATSGCCACSAYNDWMVEDWCGPQAQGRLIPLTLIPLWDAELAAAGGAPQRRPRRAGGLLHARSRRTSGCRRCTPAPGTRSSRACDETGTVIAMHIGSSSRDAVHLGRRAARRRLHHHLRQLLLLDGRLADVRRPRALPEPEDRCTPRARSAGSRTSSSAPTWCGRRTAAGAASPRRSCGRPPSSSPSTSTAASSTTPSGCATSTRSASATSCTRPTTRTPTPPGPSPARSARPRWGTSRRTCVERIVRGNAIELLGLTPDGLWPGPGA